MERPRRGRPRHPDVLTPAEWRVLEQLREGGTNAEIGARLGITADGVKFHISNMLGKLGLQSRQELAAWRPESRRGRLPALFGVPAAVASVAKSVAWVGVGAAAVAGVAVAAIAAVALVGVVLVVAGGNGDTTGVRIGQRTQELPSPAPVSPTPESTSTATPTEPPVPTPAAVPERTTITYDQLDASGAVTRPGSYAFLRRTGDVTSAIANFSDIPVGFVELRIHQKDQNGRSKDAFYDSVRVGDIVDFKTDPVVCGYRFRITSIASAGAARIFGVEHTFAYGGQCQSLAVHLEAASGVFFVWGAGHGAPGSGGLRTLIHGEPAGEGTYRVGEGSRCVINVGVGIHVTFAGLTIVERYAGDRRSNALTTLHLMIDAERIISAGIDPETCKPHVVYNPWNLREIIASIRLAPVPNN